jgi:hypothetical protein
MSLDNLDKYSHSQTIGKINSPNIPNLNGMTTASVDTFYAWLGMTWESSSNTSLKSGLPFNREYTLLEQESVDYDIEEIDLGYLDPDLEGRHFYRLTNYFFEDNYSSSGDFYRWQYERYRYMQELLYHNKISSTQEWKRPSTGEEPSLIYSDLTREPLIITIDTGKALGVKLTSDAFFTINEDTTLTQNIKLSPLLDTNLIVRFNEITNPFLVTDLGINPVPSNNVLGIPRVVSPTPTYLKMEFFGEQLAQRMFHVGGEIEEDEEILIHPINSSFKGRLLPPGKPGLNNEFWNYRDYIPPILEDFTSRRQRGASWTITPEG